MPSIKDTITIFLEYSQPSILLTLLSISLTLKLAAIQFCDFLFYLFNFLYYRKPVTVKEISYRNNYIFRSSLIILKWEQPLEAVPFCIIFFFIPSCLEQQLLCNNYFLVINSFSDELLPQDKNFFSTTTVSEELFLE